MTLVASHPLSAEPVPHAGATPAVRAEGLGKRIDDRHVLRAVSLTLAPGECVALLGANGAGKTTLLRVLATLTPPTSGRLELFGRAVGRDSPALRARLGLVAHRLMLYRDLTVRENLEFFARLHRVPQPAQRAGELLDAMDLRERADDAVRTLSRGTAQRAAIARALVHDPELLLADEPFTGLDAASASRLEDLLAGLRRARRGVLVATHEVDRALRVAQRVVVLRAGRVVLDEPAPSLDVAAVERELGGGS